MVIVNVVAPNVVALTCDVAFAPAVRLTEDGASASPWLTVIDVDPAGMTADP